MGPLSDLVDGTLKINGFGGLFSQPLGYDTFGSRVLVTLGTPTINQIMTIIKESEIDELSVSLNGLRISHLLAGCWAELSLKNDTTARPIPDPTDLNEAVKTTKQEEIEAFSSQIVHVSTKTVLQGDNMYVMTQAPEKGEEPCLPHGLCMGNTYTKMTTVSKHVAIVIKNHTAAAITTGKGIKFAQVVAVNRVPP